jgi:hypothetical protein
MTGAIETRTSELLTRTFFVVEGVRHELTTFKNGRTEVYVEYADGCGLMQFRGYYDDVCVNDRKLSERVHSALAPHMDAHREFWKSYLPGAANWLRAAA